MTRNQIAYWELEETKRHNSRTEGQKDVELQELSRHNVSVENETGRHNVAVERETTRHNVADEDIRGGILAETVRHNRTTETVDVGKLNESKRHNVASENIDRGKLEETNRHNLATETQAANELNETTRHNQVQESIGWVNAGANAGKSVGSAVGATAGLLISQGSKIFNWFGNNIKQNRTEMVRKTNSTARKLEKASKQAYKKITGKDYVQKKITLDNRHGGSRSGNYSKSRKKGRS